MLFFKLTFFFTLAVIEFLATTSIHIEAVESIWDKANHFTAFFVLCILLSFAYKKMALHVKVLWLLLFGIQIEVVQSFIERDASLLDIFADSIGIAIGVVVLKLILPHLPKIHRSLDLS